MNPFSFISTEISTAGEAMVTVDGLDGKPYTVSTITALRIVKNEAKTPQAKEIKNRFIALLTA